MLPKDQKKKICSRDSLLFCLFVQKTYKRGEGGKIEVVCCFTSACHNARLVGVDFFVLR